MTAPPATFAKEAAELVAQMTLDEKASCCSGSGFWHLQGIERLGLPRVVVSDGPHGLRRQLEGDDHLGLGGSVPATCFPAGVCIACSWDTTLCREMAERLGKEALAAGVSVVLGPAINMKRSPLCGRNFEYYSEDPYLAGELACAFVQGMQATGVGTSVKHFAANNQETARMRVDTLVDERTLREIYLPAFERAVTGAQPWTIMSAYNRLNGTYCSESEWLLTKVLRDDWGFAGLVVSDWGGTNSRVAGIQCGGADLEMPSSNGVNDRRVAAAVRAGKLDEAALDVVATRVVSLILAGKAHTLPTYVNGSSADAALLTENHLFAQKAAAECAVLLKNDGDVLPLAPLGAGQTLAIIGGMAKDPRYQGAGSSRINAFKLDTPFDALTAHVEASGGSVVYAPGYGAKATDDEAALLEAVEAARGATACIVVVGLPAALEAEGIDREHMRMPHQMSKLMAAVGEANPKTAVLLLGGAPLELPTADAVPAILYMGLAGQAMGGAVASLLFGALSPSGKLPETWPMRLEETPSQRNFASNPRQVIYREALNVGYRYFCTAKVPVRFPFGHGLSYSSFKYSKLSLSASSLASPKPLVVTVDITNTGAVSASEVVQLYVRDVEASVHRPDRELKSFAKVALAPGQTSKLSFSLGPRAFAFYDTLAADWYVEPGKFEILLGSSCEDIRITSAVSVTNGTPRTQVGGAGAPQGYTVLKDAGLQELGLTVTPPEPLLPVTANTTFDELAQSGAFAWMFVQALVLGAKQSAKAGVASGLGDGDAAVAVVVGGLKGSSLRTLQLMTGNMFNDLIIESLVHLFNGRVLSALMRLLGCGKTPRLGGPGCPDL